MTDIKDALLDFNPWWRQEFSLDFKERELFERISKFLNLPQIIAFTGLRRVGKTTLMLKIVKDKIHDGFEPKNILFFSFDEFKDTEIREVVKEYERMLEKDITKEKYLFLFDEIQKVRNWEEQIKTLYDVFKKNIKMVISGSESLFIRKKTKESLAGRIFEFKIDALSFKEFLNFRDVNMPKISQPQLYEKELLQLFKEYISSSGFPELCTTQDKEIISKYIKESVVEKIIFRDIPNIYKIEDISKLYSIIGIFMEEPGQIIELSELSSELGISRQTLSTYLKYLEDSFLIRKLYNFSKNKRKIERKLKKYYPTIISPTLLFKDDSLSQSKVFEWLIVNQLKAEFFWRDPFKNEVDVVLEKENKITPIEVKYGKIEAEGLKRFMLKFNAKKGYIITLDRELEQEFDKKTISILPAYKFLLINKYLP